MVLFWPVTILAGAVILVVWWLYRINQNLTSLPPEVLKLSAEEWTDEQIRSAWKKFEREGHNFVKYLPPKQNRRYVVVGGSGQLSPMPSLRFPFLRVTPLALFAKMRVRITVLY